MVSLEKLSLKPREMERDLQNNNIFVEFFIHTVYNDFINEHGVSVDAEKNLC